MSIIIRFGKVNILMQLISPLLVSNKNVLPNIFDKIQELDELNDAIFFRKVFTIIPIGKNSTYILRNYRW